MAKQNHRVRNDAGFTLLEVTIVLVILGVLIGLLSVGLAAARDSARRIKCSTNLSQIGMGLSNYESTFRMFPRGSGQQGHGPLVSILPYIEQAAIYDSIDFGLDVHGNPIALKTRIDLYRCPSTLAQERKERTDYVLNRGDTLAMLRKDPWFFDEKFFPRAQNFSKGLTGTSLMSETCPRVDGIRKGSMQNLTDRNIVFQADSIQFESECNTALDDIPSHIDNGRFWFGAGTANYFHISPPNSRSCGNGGQIQFSLYTATSMHSGGANTLFADGRVEFVAENVSTDVWQNLGTR